MGSCFSDSMGGRAEATKLGPVLRNPFGVQYNSTSIARALNRITNGEEYRLEELGRHPSLGVAFSLDHHSRYNCEDERECLRRINTDLRVAEQSLIGCAQAYITLGSAYVFDSVGTIPEVACLPVQAVANCHKLSPSLFERRLQSIDEIKQDLLSCSESLMRSNPTIRVTFTVSPVRHWKDGPVQNGRSKAHLLSAVHAAVESLCLDGIPAEYFPSYDIMIDELRDYRFYETDMLHPSGVACDYIWERLLDSHFDRKAIGPIMKRVGAILRAAAHRPFQPQSKQHLSFVARQIKAIKGLEQEFPWMNFKKEISQLTKGLNN